MHFPSPLLRGTLVRRYKRFLADIALEDGAEITAHCANPGAMLGITDPGLPVWVSKSDDPKRKLPYRWEIVEADGTRIGANTNLPNRLVEEALKRGVIAELTAYPQWRREVKYGENSRVDFLLEGDGLPPCYLEVKNVHLRRGDLAQFPDCPTKRGAKHLGELARVAQSGARAVVLYVIQRADCARFAIADDLDPGYAAAWAAAARAGVEALCYACEVSPERIEVARSVAYGV